MSKASDIVTPTSAAGAPVPPAARPGRRRQRKRMRLYTPLDPRLYFSIAVVALALMLAAWWLAAGLHVASELFLPSPTAVWRRGVELTRDGTLETAMWESFRRITIGFLISTAFAVPIGI